MKKNSIKIRRLILGVLILIVWTTQWVPALAACYSKTIYPGISYLLSGVSSLFPFAIGDLFVALSIAGVLIYPFYARIRKKLKWKTILLHDGEYLMWIYVWFYLAWGLNYSQPNFYQRTSIPYTNYNDTTFSTFVDDYILRLNASYTPSKEIDRQKVRDESVRLYHQLSDSLGVHRPPHSHPRVKTMLFTPLISKVGVTGSMAPFFCEFTLNGDLLPHDYPATYAHELAHLLGITSEAEANFYAYQVCTRSSVPEIRFSGYYSVLGHVMGNARRLLPEEEYQKLFGRIRPEIIRQAQEDQSYWSAKYSPLIGAVQDWMYDLYLKGNKIESGRKNYSEVVGLLISYRESLLTQ